MPKYNVKVAITSHKNINVFARDEEAAEDRAIEIVSQWENVEECEALEVEEE